MRKINILSSRGLTIFAESQPPCMMSSPAAVELHTAVEINTGANLLNPEYPERFVKQHLDYLAALKDKGVRLNIGSDCHNATYAVALDVVSKMLLSVGITNADLWQLAPRLAGETTPGPPGDLRDKQRIVERGRITLPLPPG